MIYEAFIFCDHYFDQNILYLPKAIAVMKKNIYQELTNEDLIRKKNTFKGVLIGFGIVFLLGIVTFIVLIAMKGAKDVPFAAFIPFIAIPATFVPLMINLGLINKEIKERNL